MDELYALVESASDHGRHLVVAEQRRAGTGGQAVVDVLGGLRAAGGDDRGFGHQIADPINNFVLCPRNSPRNSRNSLNSLRNSRNSELPSFDPRLLYGGWTGCSPRKGKTPGKGRCR